MSEPHKAQFRVYYEDTDAGGVVYYANYLRFAERARTEMLRALGLDQSELIDKQGILFVVRHVEADLMKPAKLDDMLTVETSVALLSGASLTMQQRILHKQALLVTMQVVVACVDRLFKPTRIPTDIKQKLAENSGF